MNVKFYHSSEIYAISPDTIACTFVLLFLLKKNSQLVRTPLAAQLQTVQ